MFWSVFATAESRDVLVVHSYHHGFFWTDRFQSGLASQLNSEEIPYRVVYLDTKRTQNQDYLDQLYRLYKTKLSHEKFSAIVVSDNNALNLMQRLAPELGDTPVIFGGINNYSSRMHQDINATGVIEDIDLLSNISLIQRLQSGVEKIYVVSDFSITGDAIRAQIDKFLVAHPEYQDMVKHYVPESFDQMRQDASSMEQTNSVLFWAYYRDKQGYISDDQDWIKLNQESNVPIYMVHDLGLGHGAVGGVIQSGFVQGREAGRMLVRVLSQPQQALPKVRAGSPEIKLDYQMVKRWNLGADGEASATFFNKPQPFFVRYQTEIQTLSSVFLLMAIIILALAYYLKRLKRSETTSRKNQLLLESIFDQSLQYIGIIDQQGKLVSSNSKLHELLYNQGFHLDANLWQHKHWEESAAKTLNDYFSGGEPYSTLHFEAEIWCRDQGSLILEVSIKPLPNQELGIIQFLLEARDVTSRKFAESKLFQRESNLRLYYDKQPVMMVTLDANNRIQQVNQFTEQLLGYTPDELLGHRPREFYVDENALIPRQVLLLPQQTTKGVWRRDIQYRHASGKTIWVRENIRPLTDSDQLLIVGEDISETRELAEQLEYQASYDLLTDTYNRNYFEIVLGKALKEVETHMRTHAMLYLDLDQLKVLNDTAGHEAGDAAILFCAGLLEDVLPYNAILARMGGDEFAVLLKDCTERDAITTCRSIISTMSEQAFLWDDIRLHLTCSIGIRLIDHTASSGQTVHAQADAACHGAKEAGRNRYNLYHEDDEAQQRRHLEMESVNLVHDALAHDRLELFAQRIMSFDEASEKMHFEILVRIKNSKGEYISPGIFMPASERYNIAHLIDRQVVSQTLTWLEAHPDAIEELGLCSINLSGHSMGNREFIEFLLESLEQSAVPCEKLCLEITETAAMSNMNQAIEFFTQVKELGCLIALDDFGSGLSSFGYLKKLPVDIVKIDGLFVRDIDVNEMDHVMVRSINDLAQQMGKRTVAEFVENTQIIDKLLELGVTYGQGYIIGRPKPLAELVDELMLEKSL
ncbi:EAL domain-containing protein [Vibrio sp. T187]|uniref:EAL domain-containing protein n=1 Tax=Vibrio TaxID=662 RepID=UPI0010C9D0EB|nr:MULTISPECIES: EAL domain-containing protein [Vibrio]MBW3697693.1 EAL domain-containing protein [Vibrio sp. T187]